MEQEKIFIDPAGQYQYQAYEDGREIVGYLGSEKDIVIPSKIEGKRVRAIGWGVFRKENMEESKICSVILPEKLKIIYDAAFLGNDLSTLVFPETLEEIGNAAFAMNPLKSVVFNNTKKGVVLGNNVFGATLLLSISYRIFDSLEEGSEWIMPHSGMFITPWEEFFYELRGRVYKPLYYGFPRVDNIGKERVSISFAQIYEFKEKGIFWDVLYRGCMGDILGSRADAKKYKTFPTPPNFYTKCMYNIKAGKWTDATAMALLLAESLVRCGEFDIEDQLENYEKWYKADCMDFKPRPVEIGKQTEEALLLYEKYKAGELQEKPREVDRSGEYKDGSGSLVRVAPIVLFFIKDPQLMLHCAAESSISTHNTQICKDACAYYAGLLRGAMHGVPKEELFMPYYAPVENYWQRKGGIDQQLQAIVEGSYKKKKVEDLPVNSWYVANALEIALWGFYHSSSFDEGMEMIMNLPGNVHSSTCIYGALAAAYYSNNSDGPISKKGTKEFMKRARIGNMGCLLFDAMFFQGEIMG